MVQFCSKCGRPLQGGICTVCQGGQNTYGGQGMQQKNQQGYGIGGQQSMQSGNGLQPKMATVNPQNIIGTILKMIQYPVTYGKKLILKADMKITVILILLQGICSGLFTLAVVKKLAGFVQKVTGMDSDAWKYYEMPYARAFLVTFFLSIALAIIYGLLLFSVHRIIKAQAYAPVALSQMLPAAAVRSAVMIPAILLSAVVFEISVALGIAMFLCVNFLGFIASSVADYSAFGQQKPDLFVFMSGIAAVLLIFIAFFAFSKVFSLYLPDVIRDSIKEMGDFSAEDLLRNIF